jgi:hypothetical protein
VSHRSKMLIPRNFELRTFNFPGGMPVTIVEGINATCPVCETRATAPGGVYLSINDEVSYAPPTDLLDI